MMIYRERAMIEKVTLRLEKPTENVTSDSPNVTSKSNLYILSYPFTSQSVICMYLQIYCIVVEFYI